MPGSLLAVRTDYPGVVFTLFPGCPLPPLVRGSGTLFTLLFDRFAGLVIDAIAGHEAARASELRADLSIAVGLVVHFIIYFALYAFFCYVYYLLYGQLTTSLYTLPYPQQRDGQGGVYVPG